MMRCDQVLEPTLRFSLAKAMSYFSGLHKLLKKVRPQKGRFLHCGIGPSEPVGYQ